MDLILVMGTSLKVAPVSDLLTHLPPTTPVVLINRTPITHMAMDVMLLGDSDAVVQYLSKRLGWDLPDAPNAPAQTEEPQRVADRYVVKAPCKPLTAAMCGSSAVLTAGATWPSWRAGRTTRSGRLLAAATIRRPTQTLRRATLAHLLTLQSRTTLVNVSRRLQTRGREMCRHPTPSQIHMDLATHRPVGKRLWQRSGPRYHEPAACSEWASHGRRG